MMTKSQGLLTVADPRAGFVWQRSRLPIALRLVTVTAGMVGLRPELRFLFVVLVSHRRFTCRSRTRILLDAANSSQIEDDEDLAPFQGASLGWAVPGLKPG
jgi:hypothetical protein